MNIHEKLNRLFNRLYGQSETDLTLCVMRRVIARLNIIDPEKLADVYEAVIFHTGDWPADQGWSGSDTNAVVEHVRRNLGK